MKMIICISYFFTILSSNCLKKKNISQEGGLVFLTFAKHSVSHGGEDKAKQAMLWQTGSRARKIETNQGQHMPKAMPSGSHLLHGESCLSKFPNFPKVDGDCMIKALANENTRCSNLSRTYQECKIQTLRYVQSFWRSI